MQYSPDAENAAKGTLLQNTCLSSSSVQDIHQDCEEDVFECCCNMYALGESDLEILTAPTIHCYRHDRNEKLNFILNVLVATSLVSAFSFGTGHFVGWSHKCRNVDEHLAETLVLQDSNGILKHHALRELNSKKTSCRQQHLNSIEGVTIEEAGSNFVREDIEEKNYSSTLMSNDLFENSVVLLDKSMNAAFDSLSEKNIVNDPGIHHETKSDGLTHVIMNTVSEITEQQSNNILNVNIMQKFREKVSHVSNKELDLLTNLKQDINVIINSLNSIFGLKSKFCDKDIKALQSMHKSFEMSLNAKLSELEKYINDPLYDQKPQTFRKQFFIVIESVDGLLKTYMKSFKKNNAPMNKMRFTNIISKSLDDLERKWRTNKFKSKDFKRKHSEKFEKFPKKKLKQTKKVFPTSDKIKSSYKKRNYLKKCKF